MLLVRDESSVADTVHSCLPHRQEAGEKEKGAEMDAQCISGTRVQDQTLQFLLRWRRMETNEVGRAGGNHGSWAGALQMQLEQRTSCSTSNCSII